MANLDASLLRDFVIARDEYERLRDLTRAANEEQKRLERLALESLVEANVHSINVTVDDRSEPVTLYTSTDSFPRPREGKTKLDVIEALRKCGHEELVAESYNANSLRGLVNEMRRDNAVPAELIEVLDLNATPALRVRRS